MALCSNVFCLLIKLHEYEKVEYIRKGEYKFCFFSDWLVLELILSGFEYYF